MFNREKWKTRIKLATAIHDYIELRDNIRLDCQEEPCHLGPGRSRQQLKRWDLVSLQHRLRSTVNVKIYF